MAPVCSASQINLLIYHYLKENGFHHACFSLRHEGRLDEEPLSKEAVIEPGQLVKILQRGLLYLAVEAHVNPDGTEKACSAPFSLVGPAHVCDGVPRPSPPKEQSTPARLTPSPPPQRPSSSKPDTAEQTQTLRRSQSRASSVATSAPADAIASTNGVHPRRDSEDSSMNVASSSKNKLDSASVEGMAEQTSGSKRKGGEGKLAKGEKRIKRATPIQVNGAQAISEEEVEEPGSVPPGSPASAKKSKKVSTASKQSATSNGNAKGSGGKGGSHAYVPPLTGKTKGKEVANDKVARLKGHSAEVFLSAWNPTVPGLLASGGGDATVRIWDLGSVMQSSSDSMEGAESITPAVCKHLPSTHAKDVSALSWNPDGTLLASGSYDGILRLWTPQGDLHLVMSMHQGPIFAVRWNRKGNFILSGSADGTAIVWDLGSGKVRQQFSLHSDSVLDIEWLTASVALDGAIPSTAADNTLATCSADNSINVLRLGDNKPLKSLRGHTDEVNAIRFDPTGTLLASVSDDMTARVWALDAILGSDYLGLSNGTASSSGRQTQAANKRSGSSARRGESADRMEVDDEEGKGDISADTSGHSIMQDGTASGGANNGLASGGHPSQSACKFVLTGHKKDIFAIAWAPHGAASAEPRLLATASFDNTARIWNADDGTCLRIVQEHTDSVYSLCFSPDRRFLVTGGMDQRMFITSMATGDVALAYAGGGGIFDIAWHIDGGAKRAIGDSARADVGEEKEDKAGLEKNKSSSSSSSLQTARRHFLALSQADRTLAVLDVSDYDSSAQMTPVTE